MVDTTISGINAILDTANTTYAKGDMGKYLDEVLVSFSSDQVQMTTWLNTKSTTYDNLLQYVIQYFVPNSLLVEAIEDIINSVLDCLTKNDTSFDIYKYLPFTNNSFNCLYKCITNNIDISAILTLMTQDMATFLQFLCSNINTTNSLLMNMIHLEHINLNIVCDAIKNVLTDSAVANITSDDLNQKYSITNYNGSTMSIPVFLYYTIISQEYHPQDPSYATYLTDNLFSKASIRSADTLKAITELIDMQDNARKNILNDAQIETLKTLPDLSMAKWKDCLIINPTNTSITDYINNITSKNIWCDSDFKSKSPLIIAIENSSLDAVTALLNITEFARPITNIAEALPSTMNNNFSTDFYNFSVKFANDTNLNTFFNSFFDSTALYTILYMKFLLQTDKTSGNNLLMVMIQANNLDNVKTLCKFISGFMPTPTMITTVQSIKENNYTKTILQMFGIDISSAVSEVTFGNIVLCTILSTKNKTGDTILSLATVAGGDILLTEIMKLINMTVTTNPGPKSQINPILSSADLSKIATLSLPVNATPETIKALADAISMPTLTATSTTIDASILTITSTIQAAQTAAAASSTTKAPDPAPVVPAKKTTSTLTIVGYVAGGIAGVSFLSVVAWWLLKKIYTSKIN